MGAQLYLYLKYHDVREVQETFLQMESKRGRQEGKKAWN
jgi:hypothetical protein